MKKIFTLLLAVLMVLGLAACGSKKAEEKKEEPTQEGTAVANEEEALYLSLQGNYTDSQTGKAQMVVTGANSSSKGVEITITQSTTASDVTEWIMHAALNADKTKLEYTSALKRSYTIDESGKQSEPTNIYTDGTGYFTYDKENLIWHSNVKDETTDIVFVKDAKQDGDGTALTDEQLNSYVGEYADPVSQRATLKIEKGEGQSLLFTVNWANGADETIEWKMTGTYDPKTYHFDYANAVKTKITTVDGKENKEELYNNGTGYFSIEGGALSWHSNVANDYDASEDIVFDKAA